jgi:2-dehydro-3-deoxygluconokinase
VTLGEVLLRLAIPSPGRVETTRQLDVQLGGAEANVAATAARLGLRTAWISAVPANPWGERARRELESHGVDCAHVRLRPDTRLGVYYVEYGAPPRPIRIVYDRRDSAFAGLTPEDVDWEPVRQAGLVHLTGITPALGVGPRALVERALREAPVVSFDVNYRARLWKPDEAREVILGFLPRVRYLFAGAEEARTVFGLTGPAEGLIAGLSRLAPAATVVLLQGEAGSIALDGTRLYRPTRRHSVQVVDPIGAGDAYVAGFLWSLRRNRSLQEAVDAAAAVAAIKCSLWGDIAPITPADVEEALGGNPTVRR